MNFLSFLSSIWGWIIALFVGRVASTSPIALGDRATATAAADGRLGDSSASKHTQDSEQTTTVRRRKNPALQRGARGSGGAGLSRLQRAVERRRREAEKEEEEEGEEKQGDSEDARELDVKLDGSEEELEIDEDIPGIPMQKVGKKKRERLARKEEKKRQTEALRERIQQQEEKRKRQMEEDEERIRIREEKKQLEEEEKKRKEEEEYQKWKAQIKVESAGEGVTGVEDEESLLSAFVDHIITRKVVILDELAVEYRMRTDDVVQRIRDLESDQRLSGVFDDRGKYIYISQAEMQKMADFISLRGRVSVDEIVDEANRTIQIP